MPITVEERIYAGKPLLSELVLALLSLKETYGDVRVSGAYDGYWNTDVYIQFFEDHLMIGSIS